ncbi:MAG: hypothetical protein U0797_17320 [Gemmataceae bacterium]
MRKGVLAAVLLGTALAATGCQRLNYSKKFNLNPAAVQPIHFGAPAYEQKVKVTIAASGGAVSAYLVKSDDAPKVEVTLGGEREPAASLLLGSRVSRGNAETYSFEATAPAKVPYTLLLRADPKPCEVTVTVTGR